MTSHAVTTIGDLAVALKPAAPLAPEDSVAKAARLLRARGLPLLLVAQGPQLMGVVFESDLLEAAAGTSEPRAFARATSVAAVMRPLGLVLNVSQPLAEAAQELARAGLAAAPVAGQDGRYLGVVTRRGVLAALLGEPTPPHIAGLATPFGVYLTTGDLRAGAGSFALASVGAALMGTNLLASYGLAWAFGRAAALWPVLREVRASDPMVELVQSALALLILLLVLRFSPVSGTHAAEHMVVHTIEAGEDLMPEKVRPMSPVHPRCGTNLVALMGLVWVGVWFVMSRAADAIGINSSLMVVSAYMVFVLVTWRRLGHGLQRFITTKRPSDRQLIGAIGVGEELLDKLARYPGARASGLRRLWNSGFPQVVSGFLAVWGVASLVEWLLERV